jgi:L-malate glycosyltransferase
MILAQMSDFSRRILLFTTAYRPFVGGSEIAIEEIVRRLPDVFFDVFTPYYDSRLPREESGPNFNIHRVGFGWRGDKFLFPLLGYLKAKKIFKKNEPAIIHAFQASYGGGAAWIFKIFNESTPMILTLQEGKDLDNQYALIRFFRKLITKKSDKITAISNYLKKYAQGLNPKGEILVIPNGVDTADFSKELSYGELLLLKDQLGIKAGEKVIANISRLVPKNGITNLIKAFKILSQNNYSLKLLLIGDGYQKSELEKLTSDLKLSDKIIFAGQVNYHNLPKYLRISDIFVRPSLSEGLGNAFIEAMAASVPIIGSEVGGIPDFLTDLKTGLFCDPKNPKDIAEKINIILQNEVLRKELVQNALKLAVEKYDWLMIAEQYKNLYR